MPKNSKNTNAKMKAALTLAGDVLTAVLEEELSGDTREDVSEALAKVNEALMVVGDND